MEQWTGSRIGKEYVKVIYCHPAYMQRTLCEMLGWRRQWHPIPVLLSGKSHEWMSLVGCSPWGLKELDRTERLHFHFSLSCIGEGNGNPLQCSCLEYPGDGGARWAAVCGVTQSRTRLKQLSSSSSSMKHKLESRSLGELSITSDMQMIPPL